MWTALCSLGFKEYLLYQGMLIGHYLLLMGKGEECAIKCLSFTKFALSIIDTSDVILLRWDHETEGVQSLSLYIELLLF